MLQDQFGFLMEIIRMRAEVQGGAVRICRSGPVG
jgi:hypothetical protein